MKIFITFFILFFNFIFPISKDNYLYQKKLSINAFNIEEKYPNITYNSNLFHNQKKLEYSNHLEDDYDVEFFVKFKDFEKYSSDYFSFWVSFDVVEQNIFLNNETKTFIDKVDVNAVNDKVKKIYLSDRNYKDSNSKTIKVIPEIIFTFESNNKISLNFLHKNFFNSSYRNKNIFKKRTIQVSQINIMIKPKIDLSFFKNTIINLDYSPYKLIEQIDLLNAEVNKKINELLDQNKVDRFVFNYFYLIDEFTKEEIKELSFVNAELEINFNKTIVIKNTVKNDKFLKVLPEINVNLKASQNLNINQLGIAEKVYTSMNPNVFNSETLFKMLFKNDYNFLDFIKIQKVNDNKYILTSKHKQISGFKNIQIIFQDEKVSSSEIYDQEILKPIDSELIDKIGEESEELPVEKQSNKKSIIMFALSFLFVVLLSLNFVIKKILFFFKKN